MAGPLPFKLVSNMRQTKKCKNNLFVAKLAVTHFNLEKHDNSKYVKQLDINNMILCMQVSAYSTVNTLDMYMNDKCIKLSMYTSLCTKLYNRKVVTRKKRHD